MDNLPELRDIHVPVGVSMWPPAYGWWVILLGVLAVILLFQIVKTLRRKSKKRYAFRLIEEIPAGNAVEAALQMSEILRRICVYKYKAAGALYGKQWVDFLNEKAKVKLKGAAAGLLVNAPYMELTPPNLPLKGEESLRAYYGIEHINKLKAFCKSWIGENL